MDSINPSAIVVTLYLLAGLAMVVYALLGATVTAMELHNTVFVLPPLLLLAAHVVLGRRMEARFAALREGLQAGARETLLWILGLAGGALLVWSVAEYIARFGLRAG